MRRSWALPVIGAMIACALLAGCGKPPEEDKAPEPTALVKTVVANPGALDDAVAAYGRAEFDPNSVETLTAPVEARVTSLTVAVGQAVSAGSPVATLSASPGALLDVDKAERDARAAEVDYQRLSRLRADGLAANNDVENAKSLAGTAAETARSLRARTGGGGLVLRATHAGVVDAMPAAVGDLVAAGGPVVKVGGGGPLRVRLGVEPGETARISPGQTVRLSPVSGAGPQFVGRVQSVDQRVDPATRLAGVLIMLPAGSGFLPGQAVKGQVVVAHHTGSVVIPRAAILYDGEDPYVFVSVGGKAVKRPVKLGVDDGISSEVSDGVRPGERVVIEGGAALDDGMKLREGPAAEDKSGAKDGADKP